MVAALSLHGLEKCWRLLVAVWDTFFAPLANSHKRAPVFKEPLRTCARVCGPRGETVVGEMH